MSQFQTNSTVKGTFPTISAISPLTMYYRFSILSMTFSVMAVIPLVKPPKPTPISDLINN